MCVDFLPSLINGIVLYLFFMELILTKILLFEITGIWSG